MAKAKTPDFATMAAEMDASGFEDATLETQSIPFIKLLQALSPQLKKSKPEFIEGAQAGMICNNVTNTLLGESLRMVVGKFERHYLEWDNTTRGKLKGVHSPESVELRNDLIRDEKNQLVNPETDSTFQETYNYYVILPDHMEEGVCILSLSSSGIKAGKKLNRMLFSTMIPGTKQKAMPYFMIFNANVVELSNDQGDWYGFDFKLDEFVTQEVLDCVVDERKALPEKTVDFAQSSDQQLLEGPKGEEPPY